MWVEFEIDPLPAIDYVLHGQGEPMAYYPDY
jgi:hypothetical protein